MLFIVFEYDVCEQPNRVQKEPTMGDDKILTSLSLVSSFMVLDFLLVHSIAVIFNVTSLYSLVLFFTEKSRGYGIRESWFFEIPANRKYGIATRVAELRTIHDMVKNLEFICPQESKSFSV